MKRISVTLITVFLLQLFLYPVTSFAQSLVANDFTKSTPKNTTLSLKASDFIQQANPPKGQNLISIRFDQVTNETAGTLQVGGNLVKKGQIISVSQLDTLVFVPSNNYEGEAIFTWTANYSNAKSPYPGAVVITIGAGTNVPSGIPEQEKNEENSVKEPQPTPQPTEEKKDTAEQPLKKQEATANDGAVKGKEQNGLKPLRYEDMLDHWGAYSAGMLASRGYIIGDDFGNRFYFQPDETINRFEFVLMVNAIFGVKPKDSLADNPFSDENVPSYMMRVGIAAHEYDIIEGTKAKNGKEYFHPYGKLTRAEAITILDYALRLDTHGVDDAEFKDVGSIPDWALQSVKNLEAYGIIQGYEDNTIRPNKTITRAQAAEMVWQTLKFLDLKREQKAVFNTIVYGD